MPYDDRQALGLLQQGYRMMQPIPYQGGGVGSMQTLPYQGGRGGMQTIPFQQDQQPDPLDAYSDDDIARAYNKRQQRVQIGGKRY